MSKLTNDSLILSLTRVYVRVWSFLLSRVSECLTIGVVMLRLWLGLKAGALAWLTGAQAS